MATEIPRPHPVGYLALRILEIQSVHDSPPDLQTLRDKMAAEIDLLRQTPAVIESDGRHVEMMSPVHRARGPAW